MLKATSIVTQLKFMLGNQERILIHKTQHYIKKNLNIQILGVFSNKKKRQQNIPTGIIIKT